MSKQEVEHEPDMVIQDALVTVVRYLLIVPHQLWFGFVFSVLWHWYIVRLGAPAISVAHAMGLSLVVRLLTAGLVSSEKKVWTWTALRNSVFVAALLPATLLLLGWVYLHWV